MLPTHVRCLTCVLALYAESQEGLSGIIITTADILTSIMKLDRLQYTLNGFINTFNDFFTKPILSVEEDEFKNGPYQVSLSKSEGLITLSYDFAAPRLNLLRDELQC